MADISTLDSTKVIPKDLEIKSQPDTDKNFTRITITNLKLNKTYAAQFQYVFKDNTISDWSPTYLIITNNELTPDAPTGITVPSTYSGWIPVELATFPTNAKRVDVYIIGGPWGTGKVAGSFLKSGKLLIPADAGTYTVQLITVTPANVTSSSSQTFTITVTGIAGETIQAPTNPNGFTARRELGGIEVQWNGTYSNGAFTGFEAINIYAGNSATATPGTYEQVGTLTANKVVNRIFVPLGTYVAYGSPVYIHAAAVNRDGVVGTIQSNVASVANGAGKATDADINDGAVVISKLASNVLFVDNLKAGTISSNSYIRSGSKTGARIELSGSTSNITTETDPITGVVSTLTYPVKPGLSIYGTNGTAELLRADYSGNLSISGSGTFSGNLYSGANFSVVSGSINAISGNIGNWVLNSGRFASSSVTFPKIELDPSPTGSNPQIVLRSVAGSTESGNVIKLNTTDGFRIGAYNSPNFTVAMDGTMTANSATITGKIVTSGSAAYTGTLTIDGGFIDHTSGLYIEAPNLIYASSIGDSSYGGYLQLSSTGQAWLGHSGTYTAVFGNENSLNFTINRTNPGDGYRSRGYNLLNLDADEFRAPSINSQYTGYRSVVVGFYGQLYNGRAFFYGPRGTSAAIHTDLGSTAAVGDVYFGTT
jgi:hypothetical protein